MSPWRARYDEAGCRTMNGLAMLAFKPRFRWSGGGA